MPSAEVHDPKKGEIKEVWHYDGNHVIPLKTRDTGSRSSNGGGKSIKGGKKRKNCLEKGKKGQLISKARNSFGTGKKSGSRTVS